MADSDGDGRVDARLEQISEELATLVRVTARQGSRMIDIEREQQEHREWIANFQEGMLRLTNAIRALRDAQEAAEQRQEAAERRQEAAEQKARRRLNAVIASLDRLIERDRQRGDGAGGNGHPV